ncbi:MAG: MopE-related protein [Acidobacteria bacterium]|jgi:hypothetical protein|nr:MopE-related protein [Acidobacteriota bacterium]
MCRIACVASGALPALLLAVSSVLAEAPAPFHGVPTGETRLSVPAQLSPADDVQPAAFGQGTEVCVVSRENWTLQAMRSIDGGQSFGPPVAIAGGPGQKRVAEYAVARGPDGRIHVAAAVIDPTIGRGLQYLGSDNLCATWTGPVDVVQAGSPAHDVTIPAVAANASGRVAILFRGGVPGDAFAVASSDAGAHWTAPAPLALPAGDTSYGILQGDVEVDPAGRVHVAWITEGSTELWRSRSIDGGLDFSTPAQQPIDQDGFPAPRAVALAVPQDGSLLTAIWDYDGSGPSPNHVGVTRSTDGGVSHPFRYKTGSELTEEGRVRFVPSPVTGTVLLLAFQQDRCEIHRSADWGATYSLSGVLGDVLEADTGADPTAIEASPGHWAVARTSRSGNAVLVVSSTNDGLTWGDVARADDGAATGSSRVGTLAAVAPEDVFVPWADRRGADQSTGDIRGNRSAIAPLSFGPDLRVDGSDGDPISPEAIPGTAIARASSSELHVGFAWGPGGPNTDIYFSSSRNGGVSFGAPVRVSTTPPGSTRHDHPVAAALADGRVFVAYARALADGSLEMRCNRSLDHGATWLPTDVLLGTAPAQFFFYGVPSPSIVAYSDGTVLVAWSDGTDVYLSRSIDSAQTFSTTALDGLPADQQALNPRLIAQADQAFLAYWSYWGVYAKTSTNRGGSWSGGMIGSSDVSSVRWTGLAGDGTSKAILVWASLGGGSIRVSRYSAGAWTPAATPGSTGLLPAVGYASPSVVLLTYAAGPRFGTELLARRSTDDGVSWGTASRLDDSAPVPAARSWPIGIVSDGAGSLWVVALDFSAGQSELVCRQTGDGGLTWDLLRRVASVQPQGAFRDGEVNYSTGLAALPSTLVAAWTGPRPDAPLAQVMVNVSPVDRDDDGSPATVDCDDFNPWIYPGAYQLCDGLNNDCNDPAWPTPPANEADGDGDSFRGCAGDCDDTDPSLYPDAPELNDGRDNQCPGDVGRGVVDELTGGPTFDATDKSLVSWPEQPGASMYQLARCTSPRFDQDCVLVTTTATTASWRDPEATLPQGIVYYLVRPLAPFAGSWGQSDDGSGSTERTLACTETTDILTFLDHTWDDLPPDALLAFFWNLTAVPSDYFLFEIQEPPYEETNAWCAQGADFYRTNYLQYHGSGGIVYSNGVPRWWRHSGTGLAWVGPTTAGNANYYGPASQVIYSWNSEAGLGGRPSRQVHPADSGSCEVMDYYTTRCATSVPWRLTIVIGPDRFRVCGF